MVYSSSSTRVSSEAQAVEAAVDGVTTESDSMKDFVVSDSNEQ